MKLIIQDTRVVATATDDYEGPEVFMQAPADFDQARMGDYVHDGTSLLAPGRALQILDAPVQAHERPLP